MMRYLLICLLLASHFSAEGQSTTVTAVLQAEAARFDAMTHTDTARLRDMLADDLVYIHSNALKESKMEHLHSIASGKIVYQKMNRESGSVRVYGKIALSSGAIQVKGLLNGNPFELRMLYTAVYRKMKKRWLLVNWQSTRLP